LFLIEYKQFTSTRYRQILEPLFPPNVRVLEWLSLAVGDNPNYGVIPVKKHNVIFRKPIEPVDSMSVPAKLRKALGIFQLSSEKKSG
jgi:hypothetical protein